MNYDLLASGILLGGSSVALALTALAARRARIDRKRADFACRNAMHYHTSARLDANRATKQACDAQLYAQRSMRAANAASLDRLLADLPDSRITVTRPETVDVIPIPRPPLNLYDEVEDTPGAVIYGADPGDVIPMSEFWRDHGEAGA